jgi:acyl-CoA:acyl-CoA alkyltransferase
VAWQAYRTVPRHPRAWGSKGLCMSGNATHRYRDTAILSVTAADAPIVVTSDEIDAQLAETYERTGLMPGMLESLAGITERRWWPEDVTFADAAAMAGAKAIAEAGIDPSSIGLLIDTSVCRDHLEPSAAVDVHEQLALSTSCVNFDLANACLGFMNGMQLAALMIDAGQIEYALIVDGEGSRRPQEATIDRLRGLDTTKADLLDNFATLTLGSGGAAMVLGRASEHPEGHRFVGGVSRAATQHNRLCVGDLEKMTTDSRGLLEAAVTLAVDTWRDARTEFDWSDLDSYVIHQVSKVHTAAITSSLEIDPERTPVIFPMRGNIGPASVPFTLALNAAGFEAGQRIACMGIGSGLNSAVIEIAW